MAKKLEEFTTKTPTTGDFIYLTRPGDKAAANDVRDEGKTAAELVARVANPRGYIDERIDSKELNSASLTVVGWYTIAETEGVATLRPNAKFNLSMQGGDSGNISFQIGCASSGAAKTSKNTTVEITSRGSVVAAGDSVVDGVRLAKSDSVTASGFKVQVHISATTTLYTQISNNLDRLREQGFFLVDPYLDDTPTLPDGVTAGTFLEAGEELSFETTGLALFFPNVMALRSPGSSDQLRVTVEWPEIPKQGTGITLTLPSNALSFIQGDGTSSASLASFTTSNFEIDGKMILFFINQTNVSSALTDNNPLFMRVNGAGCKFTIT